jgi:hypothetical protein
MEPARLHFLNINTDPYRRIWTAITIRVAWELVRSGVRPNGLVLREAREHALWVIPATSGLAEADAIATGATHDFIERLRGNYRVWKPDPDLQLLPDPRWRQDILEAADPVHNMVFRFHYADGLSLEEVEKMIKVDRRTLKGAREAVRGLARSVLSASGLSFTDWDAARFDRFLARVASAAGDRCPGPWGLHTTSGQAHAEDCPRCSRASRLMKEGVLSSADLAPPEDTPCLPDRMLDLTCVQIHPEARRHLRIFERTFGKYARKAAEGTYLIDNSSVPDLQERLAALAENGSPPNSQLRIVRREVPGRWGRSAVLGPGPDWLQTESWSMGWGEVEGLDLLPPPLPPPPSSWSLWLGAGAVAFIAALLGLWVFRTPPPGVLTLTAMRAQDGLFFRTDLNANIEVWAFQNQKLVQLFHSQSAADKGLLASGDGGYFLPSTADTWVLIAAPEPINDGIPVAGILAESKEKAAETRLEELIPEAEVTFVR